MNTNHISNQPVTTTVTNEAAPGLLLSQIDERIVKIRPYSTPLDQISRQATVRGAGSMKVEYYSVDTKDDKSTVTDELRGPVASDSDTISVKVADGRIFVKTETVMLPGVTVPSGPHKGETLVAYVSDIDGNTLSLVPVNAGQDGENVTLPTIAKGSEVVRMGRAAAELDVQTELYTALPRKSYNYCQIFKAQVEESFFQRLADKEVGWDFTDQEEVAIIDMRMGIEKSLLFGSRARITPTGKTEEVMFTGGIWNQTSEEYAYTPSSFKDSDLNAICRKAFTGRNGSARKVLLAGSGLIEKLSNLPAQRNLTAYDRKTLWGVDFSLIVSKFGTLYVAHAEVFDMCGKPDCGMIIDPEFITKYTHVPFSAERISFRKQGVRNTEGVVLTEASCLVLRHPSAHLRIVPEA